MSEPITVYVELLDEGVETYRPVTAEHVGPMLYRLIGAIPETEIWAFQPGEIVRCEERAFADGVRGLLAVAHFESHDGP